MNKARLEAFSDATFAIIITILVLEIKVPELGEHATNAALLEALAGYGHVLVGYFLSVAVIAMYWLGHHFIFHFHAETIDRWVVQLNMFLLSILALIPFSAGLLWTYPNLEASAIIYGANILLASIVHQVLYWYIHLSDNVENKEISSRMRKQGFIRNTVTFSFMIAGVVCAIFGGYWISIILYVIPVVFNNIPGTLDAVEKLFGFRIN